MSLDLRRAGYIMLVSAIICMIAAVSLVSAKSGGSFGGGGMGAGIGGSHTGGMEGTGGTGFGGSIKPVEGGFGGHGIGISGGFNRQGIGEGFEGFNRQGIGGFGDRHEVFEHGFGERRFVNGFFGFGDQYPYPIYAPYYMDDPGSCFQSCIASGNDPGVCAQACYPVYASAY